MKESNNYPNAIIFEGPDGCGKTHIAQAFAARHPEYTYFKLKKDKSRVTDLPKEILRVCHEEEAEFFTSLLSQVRINVALDRNYPSEICYGRAFRSINEEYWKEVDTQHAVLGTKIIICVKENKRDDDVFSKDDVSKVQEEYIKFARNTACNVLLLDTSNENLEEQMQKIDQFVYGFLTPKE